jgi:hypothetical protein
MRLSRWWERVPVRRLDEADLAAQSEVLADPVVLSRYRAKITPVSGEWCLWGT